MLGMARAQGKIMPVITSKEYNQIVKEVEQVEETQPADSVSVIEPEIELRELMHPDWTPGNSITCKIKLDSGEEVKIEYGRVATRKASVYQELIKRGYIPCKLYEEVK
jgi:hypothetical protein